MVHRGGVVYCFCANEAQEIQRRKCNLTRFSANFRFEDFS